MSGNKQAHHCSRTDPIYRKMKENQAWEMAGLARQDGDHKDAERWTKEAREWAKRPE
jgi:hypothetical protein